MELAFVPATVPVIPVTEGADQEYVVPVGILLPAPLVGETVNVPAEQIVAVCAFVTEGTGLTVIVYVCGVPEQAGPYVKVTANDLGPEHVVAPKTASVAEIETVFCPKANELTTEVDVGASHVPNVYPIGVP
jgi:hypothetical protein